MRTVILAALLFIGALLVNGAPARSQEARVLMTPAQTRAYHACMTAAWVQDYCKTHAWGIFSTYDRTRVECIAANRGDIFPMYAQRMFENTEGYCWNQAHLLAR